MMKFVTAIYSRLHGTQFGGRLNRDNHYLYSIKTLLTMGEEVICYTSPEEFDWLYEELKDYSNLTLKAYSLDEYEFHDKIQSIKLLNKSEYDKDAVWTYRCVELMWLKMKWLYEEAKDTYEKVFWIDAGLSHGGIIPKKFNIHEMPKDSEMPYKDSFENFKAFNKNLVKKIDMLSDDKFFAFYCNHRQHNYPEYYRILHDNLPGSVVAGLMGGFFDVIEKVYKEFESVINEIMNNNDLIQEEMALTLIYKNYPSLFNVTNFDTWYHEDWECYDKDMKSFSAFFEDLNEWI